MLLKNNKIQKKLNISSKCETNSCSIGSTNLHLSHKNLTLWQLCNNKNTNLH